MRNRRVVLQYEEAERGWRVYWSGTRDLVDPRLFARIEDAAPVAWAAMEAPGPETVDAMMELATCRARIARI